MWTWHRVVEGCFCDGGDCVCGEFDPIFETAETEGMTPPPGDGWTVVPGQVPAGRVQDGTGPTKMNRGARATKTRRGSYDGGGFGEVKSSVMKDDGRPLGNTVTHHHGPPPRV